MSTYRRHLYFNNKTIKTLIHKWDANPIYLSGNILKDQVNSPYSVDWTAVNGSTLNLASGYINCTGNDFLYTNKFQTDKSFGKYWEISITFKYIKNNTYNNYVLIDMCSITGTRPNTAACCIIYKKDVIDSNPKFYYNQAGNDLHYKTVPIDNMLIENYDNTITIGIEPIDNTYAMHYIIVNNKYKFYITDKFIARDIGNEVTWNSGAPAYIGRAHTNGYYLTNANYFIKNISMYSLNYF